MQGGLVRAPLKNTIKHPHHCEGSPEEHEGRGSLNTLPPIKGVDSLRAREGDLEVTLAGFLVGGETVCRVQPTGRANRRAEIERGPR